MTADIARRVVTTEIARRVATATRRLGREVGELHFGPPVTHVYNPLAYARAPHARYVRRFASGRKRVLFLGMNPGPFGMVQTGVPFGDVEAVRGWLGIAGAVGRPAAEHPRRPVQGFDCPRGEVSGRRLWGAVAANFATPARFFAHHYIANYCPLAFLEESGRNRTPDKLPASEREPLFAACDAHLKGLVSILEPDWLIGIGAFAEARAREVVGDGQVRIGRITHPSPANPRAQRDWAGTVRRELETLGVCSARRRARSGPK